MEINKNSRQAISENEQQFMVTTRWKLNDYIAERLDKQENYHSNKSSKSQIQYQVMRVIEITAAAAIPACIALTTEDNNLKFLTILLSIIVAITAGLMTLGDYQSNWFNHRATSEKLKAEKAKFLSRCEHYSDENLNDSQLQQLLTSNVEAILADETNQWQQRQREVKLQLEKDRKAQQKNGQSKTPKTKPKV